MISVSPANAVITADMLSIVNSKGEDLSDLVDLTVEKYEGLLTRSVKDNGLYVVTPTLKKTADLETLEKGGLYSEENGYSIRYAVAATKDGRTVTSQYDLSVQFRRYQDGLCDLGDYSTIKSSASEEAYLAWYENYGNQGDSE